MKGFVKGFNLNNIDEIVNAMDDGEVMAHAIASHFNLNPWQVSKWPYTRMFKSYAFTKQKTSLDDILMFFCRMFKKN